MDAVIPARLATVDHDVLSPFGLEHLAPPVFDQSDPELSWIHSGAAELTVGGRRPPGDIAGVAARLGEIASTLAAHSGAELHLDGGAALSQRERLCAATHSPTPGHTLRGGGQLLRTADGWLALTLARETDYECLPALTDGACDDTARDLEPWCATRSSRAIADRARLLGLAFGVVDDRVPTGAYPVPYLARLRPVPAGALGDVTVLDLSRLWAGPLAASVLASCGARVRRVVDTQNPPRVKAADRRFDRMLNGRKEDVKMEFADISRLRALVRAADVVITASRSHVLTRLGLPARGDQLWINITAHGVADQADRIGYGDDCAAEAGALVWHDGAPSFAADAIADPLTGLAASVAALGALVSSHAGRIDLNLAGVARWATAV